MFHCLMFLGKDKHKSNVSIKLKNNTEPFVYSEDDLISNKSGMYDI